MKMYSLPKNYNGLHYRDVVLQKYFHDLIILRHEVKRQIDNYFLNTVKAVNVDLFMMTNSISSPMGSGSDSEPIEFTFGRQNTYLTDSAQFGFEPIIMSGIEKLYCYLPSLRGENADVRHLNQFYHCEYEGRGTLDDVMVVLEKLLVSLANVLIKRVDLFANISRAQEHTMAVLALMAQNLEFKRVTFDDAIAMLKKLPEKDLYRIHDNGVDMTANGEIALAKLLDARIPFWVVNYDRDRVPFYQKPALNNTDKVINADLVCPPLIDGAFGGETAGAGQRQDLPEEIIDSLERQNIDSVNYQWYIDLRKMPSYQTTSGFGLGVERLLTWLLALDDIKYSTVYPRIKNQQITP